MRIDASMSAFITVVITFVFLLFSVHAEWSSWTVERYGNCSAMCGTGIQTVYRVRKCSSENGSICEGSNQKISSETCNITCPIDGGWNEWKLQKVGSCNNTCGIGYFNTTWFRRCDDPKPRYGGRNCWGASTKIQIQICNGTTGCDSEGEVSWVKESVSRCNSSCMRTLVLKRKCLGSEEKKCPKGSIVTTEKCTGDDCITEHIKALAYAPAEDEPQFQLIALFSAMALITAFSGIAYIAYNRRRRGWCGMSDDTDYIIGSPKVNKKMEYNKAFDNAGFVADDAF